MNMKISAACPDCILMVDFVTDQDAIAATATAAGMRRRRSASAGA